MRVIFLDFDGVLNNEHTMRSEDWSRDELELACVERLNQIVIRTSAKVVISSTWRNLHPLSWLIAHLQSYGFVGQVIGVTPRADRIDSVRGDEIQMWLDQAREAGEMIEQFVILDDDADMCHLLGHLVQTPIETGLTDEHVERAVRMLSAAVLVI